jgi:hypothetical protein
MDLSTLTNIPDIWQIDFRIRDRLSFIDIIKGFVPQSLVTLINDKIKNIQMTNLIISIFMDFIYNEINDKVWKIRCDIQIGIEKTMGITNRIKKRKNVSSNKTPTVALDRTNYNYSHSIDQLGLKNSVRVGGSWADFMLVVNWVRSSLKLIGGSSLISFGSLFLR